MFMCHSVLIGCLNRYNVASINQDVTVNTIVYTMLEVSIKGWDAPCWPVKCSAIMCQRARLVQVQYKRHENTVCAGVM